MGVGDLEVRRAREKERKRVSERQWEALKDTRIVATRMKIGGTFSSLSKR